MKKVKNFCLRIITFLLFISLFVVRVPVQASDGIGYIEEEGFTTYRRSFFETGGQVVILFTYPSVVFEGYIITVEIDLISAPSDDESFTINRIEFFGEGYDVTVSEFESDEVDLFVDPSFFSLGSSNIRVTNLRYVYQGFTRNKTDDFDMPITVIESELDYYKQRYYELKDEIEDLEDALEEEYGRGYSSGYDDGYDAGSYWGYNAGLEEGYDMGYVDGYYTGLSASAAEAYDEGYNEGFDMGLEIGREEGYDYGYNVGYEDGEKSKLAENNENFYKGIEKWLVPGIITVIALGGFVSIAAIKRREQ